MNIQKTAEYKSYQHIKNWCPIHELLTPPELLAPTSALFPLFSFLYQKTKEVYSQMPPRKNGETSFIHPINIVHALKEAGIKDEVTLCAGIIHDLIEEKVDIYKASNNIDNEKKEFAPLDLYEEQVFEELEGDLILFCLNHNINKNKIKEIIQTTKLLTRHKREFYYKSISHMYQSKNKVTKKRAIVVKLADRCHNIMTLQTFNNQQRVYACFKNLFILNNTKKYLQDKDGKHMFSSKNFTPEEILFKRCAKATYEAFLKICERTGSIGIRSALPIVHLAFKKFALEKGGVWTVTKVNPKETHPMRLFHGVVRKYDAKLHHEQTIFEKATKEDLIFCQRFFANFNFSPDQIQAIVDYKDAYSLKEVVAYLLYLPDYTISKFLSSDLTSKGRIKK